MIFRVNLTHTFYLAKLHVSLTVHCCSLNAIWMRFFDHWIQQINYGRMVQKSSKLRNFLESPRACFKNRAVFGCVSYVFWVCKDGSFQIFCYVDAEVSWWSKKKAWSTSNSNWHSKITGLALKVLWSPSSSCFWYVSEVELCARGFLMWFGSKSLKLNPK